MAEEPGELGRVLHRAVPAHRQPGDRPARRGGDRAEVRVDERDELADVVALPRGRPARAPWLRRDPVGVRAVGPAVGHDDDERPATHDALGVAVVQPRALVAPGAVQEVEHRVAPALRAVVARREENLDALAAAHRPGAQDERGQATVRATLELGQAEADRGGARRARRPAGGGRGGGDEHEGGRDGQHGGGRDHAPRRVWRRVVVHGREP